MIQCYRVSLRKVCQTFLWVKSVYFYRSRKPDQAFLAQRIKDIATSRVQYGYRGIHTLLKREGHPVNKKRVYRLYKEQGLQIRTKKP